MKRNGMKLETYKHITENLHILDIPLKGWLLRENKDKQTDN